MCVIVYGRESKPSDDVLNACAAANGDGNGFAWTDGKSVHYEKGISLERMSKLLAEAPSWWVCHFRIKTAGDATPFLCHPFPVAPDCPLDTVGTAREVLFHNGHHSNWKEQVLDSFAKKSRGKVKVPPGEWSDSRALAWLVSFAGRGILRFASGKFALLSKHGIRAFPDHGSHAWTVRDGVTYSNMNWVGRLSSGESRGVQYYFGGVSRADACDMVGG